jgi:hypothetical protein
MIANQLDNADNTIGTLLTGFPTVTTLYKWDETAQQFVNTSYLTDHWSSPSMTLHPGEGAILSIAEPFTIKFVGQVRDAFNIEIPKDQSFAVPLCRNRVRSQVYCFFLAARRGIRCRK